MRIWKLLAIAMSTFVVFAACGNDSDGEAAATATGEPATEGTDAPGESTGSCRDAHDSLAEAWTRVAAGEQEPNAGDEDSPISLIGRALSACESPDEWLAAAEAAGSIPEPLVPMTGLRFRCDGAGFSACGDLVGPDEPIHGREGVESIAIGQVCGNAVDAVEAWIYSADQAEFEENLTDLAEADDLVAGSDEVTLAPEVEEPAGRVVTLTRDDPTWGEALDELVATCNEIGEGGGSF